MSDLDAASDEDGFLKTLAALRQVIQPVDQLAKQVHVLQKENRTLFEKLETLRQESQERLRTLQQASERKLEEGRKEWERKLQAEREQSQKECSQLAADLAKATARLGEIDEERRLALERMEEERLQLEESMIQLESENKGLKERCLKSESIGAKLEAEVRYVEDDCLNYFEWMCATA